MCYGNECGTLCTGYERWSGFQRAIDYAKPNSPTIKDNLTMSTNTVIDGMDNFSKY